MQYKSLRDIPPNRLQLPWLHKGKHFVHATSSTGYLAVQTAIEYVSANWKRGTIDLETYCQLRPRGDLWQYPGAILRELKFRSAVGSELMAPKGIAYPLFLDPPTTHAEFMTSREMVSWWLEHALPEGLTAEEFCMHLRNPRFLMQTGLSQLVEQSETTDRDSANVRACLSLIGAGAVLAMLARTCAKCNFRREVFGKLRCRFCSRSKVVVDPDSESVRAAEVKRTDRLRRSFLAVPHFDFSSLDEKFDRIAAATLFEMATASDAHIDWTKKISLVLDKAPLVRSQLPVDFSQLGFSSKISALQAVVDPEEWDYASWPRKTELAQVWCEASRELESRRRGPGPMPASLERARKAMQLIELGLSRSKVAAELGVSASHLSHLLRRTNGHR